jgi:hypothetical protein
MKGRNIENALIWFSNTCYSWYFCLNTCLMLHVCDFLDHLGFCGFLDDAWDFLEQTGGEYLLLCVSYKILTVEEDGLVNVPFPVGLAWELCSVWRASVPKRAELSPTPYLSLCGKLVWLVSQNGVCS